MGIRHPRQLIVVGFVLLLLGFVFPVLMVAEVITTTFWLSFVSHGASVMGLAMGLFGVAMVSKMEEQKDVNTGPESWWE